MESTYGDRQHRSIAGTIDEFYLAIEEAFARGGNVVIPTFAVERAQDSVLPVSRRSTEQAETKYPGVPRFADGDIGAGGASSKPR